MNVRSDPQPPNLGGKKQYEKTINNDGNCIGDADSTGSDTVKVRA